jgi:hypothetical protein
MRFALLITISLLLTWPSKAQDPYLTGTCAPSQAETYLEVGNVRARIINNGNLFWHGSPYVYEVPAGEGVQAVFSAGFLVSGFIDDDVRAAGSTYGPFEFWSGPIPEDGSAPIDCEPFDRIWELDNDRDLKMDSPASSPSEQVSQWPADLDAPYIDVNGFPGYQPEQGDYPEMYGDEQVFWIMNDRGNEHKRFNSKPLGIEVQAHAFGFNTAGDLANTTFYRYRIENKGSSTIRDMAVGMFADIDLGAPFDDYVGTDTSSSMLYFYNADNDDDAQNGGYGTAPPAIGISIIEAAHVNRTLPSDVGGGPGEFTTSTVWPPGGAGYMGDAGTTEDLYHYMTDSWKNGETRTEGGNGSGFSEIPMPFTFPGDPVTGQFWSEVNPNRTDDSVQPADRRGFISHGTFDLAPGEWARFTFAFVWARGTNHLDSVTELREAAQYIHSIKNVILAPRDRGSGDFIDGNPPATPQFPFWVDEPYPNPADNYLTLRASFNKSGPISIRVIDSLGRTRLEQTHQAQSAGEQSLELDTSSLTPGAYTVSVESWSHRASHSFVVLR